MASIRFLLPLTPRVDAFFVALVLVYLMSIGNASLYAQTETKKAPPEGNAPDENPPMLETVVFEREGKRQTLEGRTLLEGGDGGRLFEERNTAYHLLQPDEIISRDVGDTPFQILSDEEFEQRLLREFPTFEAYSTANYLIIHNTSRAYAEWCGGLYERLNRAFLNYWKTRGIQLARPEHPLVALVFKDKAAYEAYAIADIGPAARSMLGYYNIQTNRVVMFDLTGVERFTAGLRVTSVDQVNRILLQPAAERTVATIVHEATHQISYNCGLQTRLAGNSKWVSEGMAIFFETPDLKNGRGWAGIGKLHRLHLANFQNRGGVPGTIERLVSGDKMFLQRETAAVAYSQAWALTYYLQKANRKQYAQYIRELSEWPPLAEETEKERLDRFQRVFGDVEELEERFLTYMLRQR